MKEKRSFIFTFTLRALLPLSSATTNNFQPFFMLEFLILRWKKSSENIFLEAESSHWIVFTWANERVKGYKSVEEKFCWFFIREKFFYFVLSEKFSCHKDSRCLFFASLSATFGKSNRTGAAEDSDCRQNWIQIGYINLDFHKVCINIEIANFPLIDSTQHQKWTRYISTQKKKSSQAWIFFSFDVTLKLELEISFAHPHPLDTIFDLFARSHSLVESSQRWWFCHGRSCNLLTSSIVDIYKLNLHWVENEMKWKKIR